MKIGNKQFDVENDTYVMGILNVTPDSFSDGRISFPQLATFCFLSWLLFVSSVG